MRYRVVEPNAAGRIGRNHQLADADRCQSGLFAEAPLGVCAGRTADITGGAEGDPERLGDERRIRLFAEPQDQRNPADHEVPIDKSVEEPVSSGRSFQPREIRNRRRKAADMGERLVPGKRQSRPLGTVAGFDRDRSG